MLNTCSGKGILLIAILEIEESSFSEKSVNIYHSTQSNIPEDLTLHICFTPTVYFL